MTTEALVYQRIGEFTVSFQWLEHQLREIGWLILDPNRESWPPTALRTLTNEKLIERVHELFLQALPRCDLGEELEEDFRESFADCVIQLHQIRRDRNRILHSAYIELKSGREVVGLMRSSPRLAVDEETGEALFDREMLSPESFKSEMERMAEAANFLGRAYMQLIHRYPQCDAS